MIGDKLERNFDAIYKDKLLKKTVEVILKQSPLLRKNKVLPGKCLLHNG